MCHGMLVVGGELAEEPLPFYCGFWGLNSGLELLHQVLDLMQASFCQVEGKEVGREWVWER